MVFYSIRSISVCVTFFNMRKFPSVLNSVRHFSRGGHDAYRSRVRGGVFLCSPPAHCAFLDRGVAVVVGPWGP